jgi:exodeoxyribonuclease VII large subunit
MAMLEKRKTALAGEGLFDPARKQVLPFLPDVIGVVTSPTGAVIRDILHRLRDRFPRKVLVWPVAVQGANCAAEVARAIDGFNAMSPGGALPRPNLLIVARGGGAIEDLWGFNEEIVARAAAASQIPLISAVGHETDTTLIDFVSDMRAPTPSAAAELAVPVRLDLLAETRAKGARAAQGLANIMARRRQRLADLARALPRPDSLTHSAQQRLDHWEGRLPLALRSLVQKQQLRLIASAGQIKPSALGRILAQETRQLQALGQRLPAGLERAALSARQVLGASASRLRPTPLTERVGRLRKDLDDLDSRLQQTFERQLQRRREQLVACDRLRETLGYRETLRRGYAVVRSGQALITTVAGVEVAKSLEIEFADGCIAVAQTATARPAGRAKPKPPEQGQLF